MDMFETKTCPQCGQETFSDMPICYGCMHPFGAPRAEARVQAGTRVQARRAKLPALGDLDEPDIPDAVEDRGEADGSDSAAVPAEASQSPIMMRISTGDARTTIAVPQAGLTIGRDALSDVVLKSRAVSKRHVRVVPLSSAVIVEDLGATNPATYKGREIRETAVVRTGEYFDVCGATFTVMG